MGWSPELPRTQRPLSTEPYDRWVSPQGVCMAEFHRLDGAFRVRFPGQADFILRPQGTPEAWDVQAWPTLDCDAAVATNLYHNAIEPMLGNYNGGLFLHGSAVRINDRYGKGNAIAFLGLSRGGKTTLAGSFAKAGNPFLTEDVIDLRLENGQYWLQPKRSKLRLFADSARFLLGDKVVIEDAHSKQDIEATDALPFANEPVPLKQIYVLGTDHQAPVLIRSFSLQEALSALMPHAFILDVEDRERLQSHFARIADLSQDVGCYALDFTRDYGELPKVRAQVLANFGIMPRDDERI